MQCGLRPRANSLWGTAQTALSLKMLSDSNHSLSARLSMGIESLSVAKPTIDVQWGWLSRNSLSLGDLPERITDRFHQEGQSGDGLARRFERIPMVTSGINSRAVKDRSRQDEQYATILPDLKSNSP